MFSDAPIFQVRSRRISFGRKLELPTRNGKNIAPKSRLITGFLEQKCELEAMENMDSPGCIQGSQGESGVKSL
jgi:hypothetical protein